MATFRLGINYWPAQSAMGFWPAFDAAEVAADFARIAEAGFDSVRLFLLWEHFQPDPNAVDKVNVARLVTTFELAQAAGLAVMPTLFTGHMSGVNWIPGWALGGGAGDPRFRVWSEGRIVDRRLRDWYTDEGVTRAQTRLAGELATALRGHSALYAWDLGNENSNCVVPPNRAQGKRWLARMCDAIRDVDDGAPVTIGLHVEDLENDRRLGPAEAAEVCDFLTMHGYPGYAKWSRGPTDEQVLPFVAQLTSWLGDGAQVVFSEFGLPTYRADDPASEEARSRASTPLVEETEAAAYVERALAALREGGCTGAMLWCHADYAPSLWDAPPLDIAVHERSFGLWRADTSPKPAVAAIGAARGREVLPMSSAMPWIDIERRAFYQEPSAQLPRLYARYCETLTPR